VRALALGGERPSWTGSLYALVTGAIFAWTWPTIVVA